MYCKKCGNKIEDNSIFCNKCGYKRESNEKNNHENNNWINKRNKIIIKVIIGIILFSVFIAIGSEKDKYVNNSIKTNNSAIEDIDKNSNNLDAIDKFKDVLSNENLNNDNKINTLKNLAFTYLAEENTQEALKTFQEALGIAIYKSFDYYLINGEINNIKKLPEETLYNYKKAYELESNNFQINNVLGLFYMDLEEERIDYKNYNTALQYNKKAVELNPELETMKENLAINYFLLEDYDNSLKFFLQTNLNSKALNNYYIGLIYISKENNILAKKYLKKAIDLNIEKDLGLELYNKTINYLNSDL